jgi:hypothetical protein
VGKSERKRPLARQRRSWVDIIKMGLRKIVYKLEDRLFYCRMRWIFSIYLIVSAALWTLGSTRPLTEMSTRNLAGGKKRPVRRADKLAAIYEPNV